MTVYINNYRGFDIHFNDEAETFLTALDDTFRSEKKSYSAIKKAIDEYLKANAAFVPFMAEEFRVNGTTKRYEITGIRKDGAFMAKTENGIEQISKYYEKDIYLVNEANEKYYAEIAYRQAQRDALRKEIKEYEEKIIKVTLKDIKHKYIQP